MLAAYVLGFIDEGLLRPVDVYVHRVKAKGLHGKWGVTLRQCVLVFSDQQIVTGIAILIAGFASFSEISVYHFQIVIYLGWMSSSVHLSALTMLAEYLGKRRALLSWRIVGMMMLFVLLLVALIPTASNYWAVLIPSDDSTDDDIYLISGWAIPAKCFWLRTYGNGVNPDAPLGFILLLVSYIWKIGGLFKTSRGFHHRWIRGVPEYYLEKMISREAVRSAARSKGKQTIWRYRFFMGIYVVVIAFFEFGASFAASLWLSFVGLVFGTMQIEIPRSQNLVWSRSVENKWSFGQIVPLVLLIQPLGAVLEQFRKKSRHGSSLRSDSSASSQSTASDSDVELDDLSSNAPRHQIPSRNATPSKRMSEQFAVVNPLNPSSRSLEPPEHQRELYNSLFFTSLICWIHAAILGISTTVFVFDSYAIGNVSTANWWIVLVSFGAFIGVIVLWTILAMPFSRVFR